MAKARLGIIVSKFHSSITGRMEARARGHAESLGMEVAVVQSCPGAYDSPFVAAKMLKGGRVDAIAVLGTVLKGETDHDLVVSNSSAIMLQQLAIQHGKPITLGVIGPRASLRMAEERAEEYAERAVDAAHALLDAKKQPKARSH